MSQQNFNDLYKSIRDWTIDEKKLASLTKDKLVPGLIQALNALKEADILICAQADTIMKCNSELVEQCKINRNLNCSVRTSSGTSQSTSKKSSNSNSKIY